MDTSSAVTRDGTGRRYEVRIQNSIPRIPRDVHAQMDTNANVNAQFRSRRDRLGEVPDYFSESFLRDFRLFSQDAAVCVQSYLTKRSVSVSFSETVTSESTSPYRSQDISSRIEIGVILTNPIFFTSRQVKSECAKCRVSFTREMNVNIACL